MSDDRSSEAPEGTATRRGFLARAGAMAGGLLAVRATPAAASTPAATAPETGAAPAILRSGLGTQQAVTRYDVTTFTDGSQQLTSLKAGVNAMKQKPASDPTSWDYQANIHAIFCDSPPAGTTVVHYSWRFVVWHRAYLYYFEKILRAASGNPTLSLPYWNWSVNLQIPSQYWGNGNPLYDPRRNKGPNDRLDPRRTAINNILGITNFPAFGGGQPVGDAGALEVGPHNYVHSWIGGDMGAFATAARDPVFWAHHANVDRVWYLWNMEGNANPTDPAWLNTSYPFYDIDQRATVNVTFAQAAALPVRYAPPPAQVVAVSDPAGTRPVTGADTSAPVALSPNAVASVLGASAAPSATLRVVGATLPRNNPVTVDVFASAPGAPAGGATSEQAFAGSFTLVPTGPNHAQHGPVNAHVAMGPGLVRALSTHANAAGPLGAQPANVSFTLAPSAEQAAATETVSYDRLELHVP